MTVRRLLAAVVGASTLAAPWLLPASASAAGPTRSVETQEFTIAEHPYFSEVCGFPVELHVWGSWNVVAWTDEQGRVTKEIRNFRFRSTSTANGVSVNGVTMGPEIWTFAEDGTSEGRIMGVVNRRVPGQGTVTLFAGYEVHVVDGDVDIVVGEPAGQREDAALLCSAFTS